MAAFQDSAENLMIYRRFGYLQSRLLLEKQNSLRILEEELDRLDMRMAKENPRWLRDLHCIPSDTAQSREDLLERIEKEFCGYGKQSKTLSNSVGSHMHAADVMAAAQQLVALNRPSNAEYSTLRRYICTKKPLVPREASWFRHKLDLITLRPGRERAWLDATIEKVLRMLHCRLIEVSITENDFIGDC